MLAIMVQSRRFVNSHAPLLLVLSMLFKIAF